jgi:enoyl-CoA hydratase/carnithine racemase
MTTDRHSAPTSGVSSPYDTYATLQVSVADGIAWVTLDSPPVNVLGLKLIADLSRFAAVVRHDEQVQVIVLQSANPDFFIAHVDMELVHQWEEAARVAAELFPEPSPLNVFQQLNEQWRTLPQLTIGKLQGLVRCGGSELAMALDMRFAARGQAGIGQTEVLMGIVPGGGATAYLPRLIGRARALEAIAGANLFDTDLAERYGWITAPCLPRSWTASWRRLLARWLPSPPGWPGLPSRRSTRCMNRYRWP